MILKRGQRVSAVRVRLESGEWKVRAVSESEGNGVNEMSE